MTKLRHTYNSRSGVLVLANGAQFPFKVSGTVHDAKKAVNVIAWARRVSLIGKFDQIDIVG